MMIFFLDADEKVYARYGQRDKHGPDERQSLAGLHYTMESVLKMHESKSKLFAPKKQDKPLYISDLRSRGFRGRRCLHCHQVQELMQRHLERNGEWKREMAWRYPLPDNLGMILEIDRGNIVKTIEKGSPAAKVGLQKGDRITRLHDVPIHSIADAQYALDRAPAKGSIAITWQRGNKKHTAKIELAKDWKRSSLIWRASSWRMVPSLPLYGEDLKPAEKKALGLKEDQLAFRQRERVHPRTYDAGIRGGDIILGVDNHQLTKMDLPKFLSWIRDYYLAGDQVKIQVLRDGKKLSIPYTLRNR